jgi:methylglutaconyl-CoA hydratase
MNQGTLNRTVRDGVGVLEFFHPQGNSFPARLLKDLEQAIIDLGNRDEVQVIVLQSDTRNAFCGGASFEELLAISDGAEGKTFFSGFVRVINAMRRCPKLIIGRIHGKAVGGGVGLAAACDYCYATERASIRLSELAIGIGPFVIAPAIERKMGLAALTRLSLEPTHWQTAYWAQEKGLFGRVFETVEELDTEVGLLASKLAGYNPKALVEMKRLFWEGTDHWDELLDNRAAISGRLVMSTASKEALKKFK